MMLPAGFMLDRYQIRQVLGHPGGFGVTYFAIDTASRRSVAIKELFPTDCMVRDPDGSMSLIARSNEDALAFQEALRMFQEEAKILLELRHENIVRALDYFFHDQLHTAYLVMQFEHGYNFEAHLKAQRPGRLNENELLKILDPLLDGLEAVHRRNYLHRDLKPSNIYITQANKPMLIDFGAARQSIVGRTRPMTMILTEGFAPLEQYTRVLKQGPYTDIYAMGAVLCFAMTNSIPESATNRQTHDQHIPLARRLRKSEYSRPFLEAVDWALQLRASDRPQSVAQWRAALHRSTVRSRAQERTRTGLFDIFRTRRMPPHPVPPGPALKPEFVTPQQPVPPPQPGHVHARRPPRSSGGPPAVLVLLLVLLLASAIGCAVWFTMNR